MNGLVTREFFDCFLVAMTALAVGVFVYLQRAPAGYGVHRSRAWGATVDNRMGWVLMESPVVLGMAWLWLASDRSWLVTPLVFMALFNLHYCQRSFVFPLLIRGRGEMPWSIVASGALFNSANAFMQGTWIFFLSADDRYTAAWLATPQFVLGTVVFLAGWVINLHSDSIIRNLRQAGDSGHYIPRGGMFRYVTSANYLGELVEWLGWALLTWSWAGAVFALWTFANLAPRAATHHRWYQEKFGEDYPAQRKRLLPFIY
ncbi:MAG: DUF1295 domain-containing protein [Deltaproteobacteria bacterium]|nr:DUF1295 domain-containing protein [Deltaproteobacteria bacterium]